MKIIMKLNKYDKCFEVIKYWQRNIIIPFHKKYKTLVHTNAIFNLQIVIEE